MAAPGALATRGLMECDIIISVSVGLCEDGREAGRRLWGAYQQQGSFCYSGPIAFSHLVVH